MRVEIQATHVEDQDGNHLYQIDLFIPFYCCAFDIPYVSFPQVKRQIEELFSPEIALDAKLNNIEEIISQIQTIVIFKECDFDEIFEDEEELDDMAILHKFLVEYAVQTSTEQVASMSILQQLQFKKYEIGSPNLN